MDREGVGVAVLSLRAVFKWALLTVGLVWFCSSQDFSFSDRIPSRQYWRYSWTGWVCLAAPALHNRLCSVTIPGMQSSQPPSPCAAGELRCACEVSPVQLCPSRRDGQTAGCFLCVCHFSSSSGTVEGPSPTSQGGWHLTCLLRVKDPFGFVWYFISR